MHELSLCRSVYGIVERARGGRNVTTVNMRIGKLRQVIPETLEFCWGLVTAETPLHGARLDIEHVPVTLDCRACGATSDIEHELLLTCAACGSGDIAVVGGEEFLVTSIDLAPAPACGDRPVSRDRPADRSDRYADR